jgi:hypothetical protein
MGIGQEAEALMTNKNCQNFSKIQFRERVQHESLPFFK